MFDRNSSPQRDFETPDSSPLSPREFNEGEFIPALYLEPRGPRAVTDKIMIYWHGSTEDIGDARMIADKLCQAFRINVLVPEYCGYGIYEGEPSAERVLEDAEIIYRFLVFEIGFYERNVVAFGRSIGSGPATHVASKFKPGAVVLMSPFTSIKNAAKAMFGVIGEWLLEERLNNLEAIKSATSPILLIHGVKDTMIPYEQSILLKKAATKSPKVDTYWGLNMTHNDFRLSIDLLNPMESFLFKMGILVGKEAAALRRDFIALPPYMPREYRKKPVQTPNFVEPTGFKGFIGKILG